MEKAIKWIIKKLVNLHYKRAPFLVWSWGIDENTDIHIVSEEAYPDRHRYGLREEVFTENQKVIAYPLTDRNCDNCGTPSELCKYCIDEDSMWTPMRWSEGSE